MSPCLCVGQVMSCTVPRARRPPGWSTSWAWSSTCPRSLTTPTRPAQTSSTAARSWALRPPPTTPPSSRFVRDFCLGGAQCLLVHATAHCRCTHEAPALTYPCPVCLLQLGHGREICGVLDGLVDYVLERRNFSYKRPMYLPDTFGMDDGEAEDEDAGQDGDEEAATEFELPK